MNNAVTTAQGPEGQNPGLPVLIQSKEDVTTQQVATILNVVHVMRHMMQVNEGEESNRLHGEARVAAQTTLVKACGRLDAILDEKDRWTVSAPNKLHKIIIEVHQLQKKMMEENIRLIQNAQRPSVIFKPNIATMGPNYFIAFWGKLEQPGMHIVGRGRTPSEALADFDRAFDRTPREQFRAIAEFIDGPTPEPPAETPEDFNKNNPPQDPTSLS